jgi:hypothetical protein
MKNMVKFFWFISIFVLLSATLPAQVPLPHYDGFNYTVGQNLGAQTSWQSLNTGDSLLVSAGSLTYTGFAASTGNKIAYDGAGVDAAKKFDSLTTGTAYYSYLLNVSSVGTLSATGGYFTTFYQSLTSTTGGACVWTRLDGAAYDIGISVRINTPVTWSTVKSLGTTYLIVASYNFVAGDTNDVCNIWINPNSSTFGAATAPAETMTSKNTVTDLTGVARVQIRQDGTTTTPFIELDELRIGKTWADVTPKAGSTSVSGNNAVTSPREMRLDQNYPNPFNPSTTISYQIPANSFVRITVSDVLGNDIATLVNENKEAGYHNVQFNAGNRSSGMYFYRIQAGDMVSVKKMMLMK